MKSPTDVLFTSDLWMRALERYGSDTNLSVKLFDADMRVVFGPVNPTPLFQLFAEIGYDPGIFVECARRCLIQTESRPAILISEVYGLAAVGTSLALEGKIVGAAVAGYTFVDFSQPSEVQCLARNAGVKFERLWQIAREQKPVPRHRLMLNGELLQVLGDALLRENYRTRQYQEAAGKLEEVIRAKNQAHQELQKTAAALRDKENALRHAHDELESLVQRRTATLRRLTGRLQHVQDEERRKMARELHDSAGQYLAALKMNLAQLDQAGPSRDKSATIAESEQLIDRCLAEIRTVSYLLHPPLLDESGLASAAKFFIDGFAKRSDIKINLAISPRPERMPQPVEIALFRVLQEGLTNVHRHSGSPNVDIRIDVEDGQATLRVRDFGRGIAPDQLESFEKGSDLGVGLAGMRERVNELGGTLQILPEKPGTLLTATVPIRQKQTGTISSIEHSEERGSAA